MDEEVKIGGNADINEALKDFELKSKIAQIQKASENFKNLHPAKHEVEGVKFEVPSYGNHESYQDIVVPKMVQFVIKWSRGAIENQKQAEWLLFGFVILAIGISLFLFLGGVNSNRVNLEEQRLYPPGSSALKNNN